MSLHVFIINIFYDSAIFLSMENKKKNVLYSNKAVLQVITKKHLLVFLINSAF